MCIARMQKMKELLTTKRKRFRFPGNFTSRDILQIRAFHAAFKLLHDLTPDMRFVTAICQTSDDMFKMADKDKILEWEREYGGEYSIPKVA